MPLQKVLVARNRDLTVGLVAHQLGFVEQKHRLAMRQQLFKLFFVHGYHLSDPQEATAKLHEVAVGHADLEHLAI